MTKTDLVLPIQGHSIPRMSYNYSAEFMDYEEYCCINDRVKFERYYNQPVDTGDYIFASMHYYMQYLDQQEEKKLILEAMTLGLKELVADMAKREQAASR